MGEAFFYHLTRRPLEATLPVLLDRSLAAGWRVIVRGTDQARLRWLDERLWLGPQEGFLPHGMADGVHDEYQPVLLSADTGGIEDRQCLMAIDGASVAAEEVAKVARVCILFDGNDGAAVTHARTQWKSLTHAGCPAQYWSEESGRWEKKAEA